MAEGSETGGVRKVVGGALNALATVWDEGAAGLTRRLGRIVRDTAAEPFWRRLRREVDDLVRDPAERAARLEAPETQAAIAELADDLDEAVPDARRLDMLRRAFLAVVMGDREGDPDATLGLLFLRTARKLSAEQAVVLGAAFRTREQFDNGERTGLVVGNAFSKWAPEGAKETGITYLEPLKEISTQLVDLLLFNGPRGALPKWNPRVGLLTDFGIAFCQFLERSERRSGSSA